VIWTFYCRSQRRNLTCFQERRVPAVFKSLAVIKLTEMSLLPSQEQQWRSTPTSGPSHSHWTMRRQCFVRHHSVRQSRSSTLNARHLITGLITDTNSWTSQKHNCRYIKHLHRDPNPGQFSGSWPTSRKQLCPLGRSCTALNSRATGRIFTWNRTQNTFFRRSDHLTFSFWSQGIKARQVWWKSNTRTRNCKLFRKIIHLKAKARENERNYKCTHQWEPRVCARMRELLWTDRGLPLYSLHITVDAQGWTEQIRHSNNARVKRDTG
jgi:hypothetical protein